MPESPEDFPSEFGPMGSKFDFNTLPADQAAAATGGNKPIDLYLGGKTTKFDWKNSDVPWEMIGDVASAGFNAID